MLDTSRSMYRKEEQLGGRSRVRIAMKIIKEIVRRKKKEDQSDRYAIVTFNGAVKHIKEMAYTEKEIMEFIKEKAEFAEGTALGEGLAAAMKIIVQELPKIGEKTVRVLVISDGINLMSAMNPLSIAKIGQELGIIIDAIRLGPAKVPGNILKRITSVTGGSYHFVSNMDEIKTAIVDVAKKKEQAVATIFDKKDGDQSLSNELLSEIAGNLLKLEDLTPEQKFKIFQTDPNKKLVCSICYSNNCMVCETSFYGCGRFCPNCLTPMHLHCSMAWADQQKKDNNKSLGNNEKYKILRCVHCFYLLKIPITNVAAASSDEDNNGTRTATKMKLEDAPTEVFNTSCAEPNCGILFSEEEDEYIYKCNYCNSYFHDDCFEDYHRKDSRCPNCNKVVRLEKQDVF